MTTEAPDDEMMDQPEVSIDDLAHAPEDDGVGAYDDGDDEMSDAEKQATYLAGLPDWAVIAPGGAMFANATWLKASGTVLKVVSDVFDYEEFRHLHEMPFAVRWRRKTKPFLRNRFGETPLLASVYVVDPRVVWEMHQREEYDFPRLIVDLNWQHWEDAVKDGRYLPGADVQWGLHRALSVLDVDNDIIKRIPPDVQASEHEIRRFGMKGPGWSRTFRAQQEFWPDDSLGDNGS